jgi:hypothetical protein
MNTSENPGPASTPPRRRIVVLATIVSILLLILAAEGAARVAWYSKNRVRRALARSGTFLTRPANLHAYQMPDPKHPANWVLRPGFKETLEEWMVADGRPLSRERMQQVSKQYNIAPDSVILRINAAGYKGPELDSAHSRVRILTIGNSCVFGSAIDFFAFPRAMERELGKFGSNVEVVNAGVEGYQPWNVLLRLDDFAALRPEVTVVYLGWNALFQEKLFSGIARYSVGTQLVDRAREKMASRRLQQNTKAALAAYDVPKKYDPNDPILSQVDDDWAPSFMGEMEEIIDRMERAGSKVVLVTLPALYQVKRVPTEAAMAKGHLPTFTRNPLVLARMTEAYNARLKDLANKRHIPLVDIAAWSDSTLQPSEEWFMDSVHLTEAGQARLGEYLAQQLRTIIPAAPSKR